MVRRSSQSGFTIVELLLAVVLIGFLIVSFSVASISFLNAMYNRTTEARLTAEAQTLTRTISADVRGASGILANTTITDSNQSGGWATNANTLVLAVPAETTSRDISLDGANNPRTNQVVYYYDSASRSLRIRSLANSSVSNNFAITSCPVASATASCPADVTLSENVSAFTLQYYDDADAVTTTYADATSVRVQLTLDDSRGNQPITITKELRMSLRPTS